MLRFRLLLFFSFFLGSVSGQTTKELTGIVWSGNSKEALPGASITIYHGATISGLIANKEGRFVIATGTMIDSLRVSMVGYYTKTFFADKLNGATVLEARLDIAAAELQEVVVKPFTAVDV